MAKPQWKADFIKSSGIVFPSGPLYRKCESFEDRFERIASLLRDLVEWRSEEADRMSSFEQRLKSLERRGE
jgi:hypothetical protein